MTKEIILPYLYKPRKYQCKFLSALNKGAKRALWIVHRRGGKDLTCWNWIISALMCKKQTAYYLLPTYAQAKKIIWEGMTKDGIRFLDFIPPEIIEKKSESELSIRFVSGSFLQLLGSDNYDRLVGTNPSICVFSEFSLQNPNGWNYIRPILAENEGTAIFISTPRGKNHFFDLYKIAMEQSDDWFCERLTVEDTSSITPEAIERERKSGMSDELIEQEFYCSFEIGVEGSYYGKGMRTMEKEGRICNVPFDKNLLVYTCWDLGFSDSTSILFFQRRGNELLIIDYYENQGYNLSHYIKIIKDKEYTYGKHFIPHDGKNHNNTGTTFQQVAKGLGITMEVLKKEKSVIEGIERVRGMLPRVYMDKEKCDFLVRCMLQYHADYNEKDRIYRNYPKHDWSSHAADTVRYMSMVINDLYGPDEHLDVEKWRKMKQEQQFGRVRGQGIEDFFKPGMVCSKYKN